MTVLTVSYERWSRFAALWVKKTGLWLGWVAPEDGGAAVDAECL
jgi:hypothetical protein